MKLEGILDKLEVDYKRIRKTRLKGILSTNYTQMSIIRVAIFSCIIITKVMGNKMSRPNSPCIHSPVHDY